MSIILKEKLKYYLQQKNISIRELERQAGLSTATISSILIDKSKNPKLETILKIADTLGCSLDELFGREQYIQQAISTRLSYLPSNSVLFESICIYMAQFIDTKPPKNFDIQEAFNCFEEIYKYSIENKIESVDIKFANWCLNKGLKY